MDDLGQLIPELGSESSRVKKLNTVPAFSFHLFVSTVISIVGIVFAMEWEGSKRCEAYFIMIYLRVAFWFLTLLMHCFVKHSHEKLRLNGYHEFCRDMKTHKSVPLFVVSLWNTTILTVESLMQHYYGPNFATKCIETWLSPIVYITAFHLIEWLILMFVNISYIIKCQRFKKANHLPDALRNTSFTAGSVGLTQRNSVELLERQADLINYLKDHNMKLNQKLMQINTQLRTVTLPAQPNI